MPGTLYLVATPIGNLEDLSRRAERVLGEVDLIACEDTRHTHKLLNHFGISTPTVSYHEHNEASRSAWLVEKLTMGASVALVSDAGTPLVSDPGHHLVARAIDAAIPVVAIPGPSAILAALAASGLALNSFHFSGFLPSRTAARRKAIGELGRLDSAWVFFEAPHRILDTLADLDEMLGTRRVVVARELTKVHEELLRGTAAGVRAVLAGRGAVKGEFTVVVSRPEADERPQASPDAIRAEVARLVGEGLHRMEAMKRVAHACGLSKREVYRVLEG